MKIKIEKSLAPKRSSQIIVPILATILSLFFCALFLSQPVAILWMCIVLCLEVPWGVHMVFPRRW